MYCNSCNSEYDRISQHWSMSDCNYPNIPEYTKEIITGGMMGDATVGKSSKYPRIQYKMTNRKYLNFLDNIFGYLSTGVSLSMTSEEKAKEDRLSGFNPEADSSNYSNVYALYTMCHPQLSAYTNWYRTGEKKFPDNLTLSNTVLKHWYVCDGGIYDGNIEFGISNESENIDKILSYFSESGLPEPCNIKRTERKDGSINTIIRFNSQDSKELLNFMGEPIDGFEYKWKHI